MSEQGCTSPTSPIVCSQEDNLFFNSKRLCSPFSNVASPLPTTQETTNQLNPTSSSGENILMESMASEMRSSPDMFHLIRDLANEFEMPSSPLPLRFPEFLQSDIDSTVIDDDDDDDEEIQEDALLKSISLVERITTTAQQMYQTYFPSTAQIQEMVATTSAVLFDQPLSQTASFIPQSVPNTLVHQIELETLQNSMRTEQQKSPVLQKKESKKRKQSLGTNSDNETKSIAPPKKKQKAVNVKNNKLLNELAQKVDIVETVLSRVLEFRDPLRSVYPLHMNFYPDTMILSGYIDLYLDISTRIWIYPLVSGYIQCVFGEDKSIWIYPLVSRYI